MTVNEFWARIAINAVILVIGVVLLASGIGLGGLLVLGGLVGGIYTAVKAQRQVRAMDAAVAEKRARQSSSS